MNCYHRLWLAGSAGAKNGPISSDLADFLRDERGLDTRLPEKADPFLLPDMEAACARLKQAFDAEEKIFIHGDYDVDGLTSTAVLARYFKARGARVISFIPNRLDDGYGLGESGIEEAIASDADLLLTVDCGIRSLEEVQQLREAGIDCIITDHHEPGEDLPEASAVIDPKREDSAFPFAELAGAGVAYKLTEALDRYLKITDEEDPALPALAMLGTVADVMPLKEENRRIVLRGLEALKEDALPGISFLIKENQKNLQDITVKDLAFSVCPKLNAAGRMGEATPAFDILQSEDPAEIRSLSEKLNRLNDRRRSEEAAVVESLEASIQQKPELLAYPLLLLSGDDFHPGVLGIAASRIRERYHKPAIVFSKAQDERDDEGRVLLKGSGRSEGSFDLLACLERAKDLLYTYGGHKAACGVTFAEAEKAEVFQRLQTAAAEQKFLLQDTAVPADVDYLLFYDAMCTPDILRREEYDKLQALEPFGKGNEEPLCLFVRTEILEIRIIGRDNTHLRLKVRGPEGPVEVIAFGMADRAKWLNRGDLVTIAGRLELNEWNGKTQLQVHAEDILLPGEEALAVPSLKTVRKKPEPAALKPSDIVRYWKTLEDLADEPFLILSLRRIPYLMPADNNCTYSLKQVKSMHKIFLEAGLIRELAALSAETKILAFPEPKERVTLSDTAAWRKLEEEGGLEA